MRNSKYKDPNKSEIIENRQIDLLQKRRPNDGRRVEEGEGEEVKMMNIGFRFVTCINKDVHTLWQVY